MKAIIDLYPGVYLTAIGIHDGVKEDGGTPVEADREPSGPMVSGFRFKQAIQAALARWRNSGTSAGLPSPSMAAPLQAAD